MDFETLRVDMVWRFNIVNISVSIKVLGAVSEEIVMKNLANSEKAFDIRFSIIRYFDWYGIDFWILPRYYDIMEEI